MQSERFERCNRMLVTNKVTHMNHGIWSSHYSICLSTCLYIRIYIYISIILLRSNQSGGQRRLVSRPTLCVSKHYQWSQETSRIFHIRSHCKFKTISHLILIIMIMMIMMMMVIMIMIIMIMMMIRIIMIMIMIKIDN